MKLALDAAAGDSGTGPNVEGALQAADRWGLQVALVGPAAALEAELKSRGISVHDQRFEIVDAPDVIAMSEEPAAACRARPACSVMASAELVASGKASGFVSAGHSGAAMVAALRHLKRLPGVLRPAIACPIPTLRGLSVLLDAGANVDCKPWHLLQFAVMGAIYAEHVFGIAKPRVGILSIGEEESKGNDLVKETFPLLKSSGLDFYGTVEGRDIPAGTTDVIVCDGFVGNVAVKTIEGTSSAIIKTLKDEIGSGLGAKLGALLLRGTFGRLKKKMSYDEYGGGPLLGVDGNAIIAHGRSNAKAIANALGVASRMADAGINAKIARAVEGMQTGAEQSKVGL